MPLVAHVRELSGMVVHEEFREGNAAPAAGHVPFLEACLRRLPKGIRITRLRADSASYQAGVFNLCSEKNIRFAIGADLDPAVRDAIGMIPDTDWRPYRDGHIAETVHTMNKTHNAFRLIVVRKRIPLSLPALPTEPPSLRSDGRSTRWPGRWCVTREPFSLKWPKSSCPSFRAFAKEAIASCVGKGSRDPKMPLFPIEMTP